VQTGIQSALVFNQNCPPEVPCVLKGTIGPTPDIVSTIQQLILVFRYHQVAEFEIASWLINKQKWREKKTFIL
jgi:hypothetical protein